MKLLHPPTDERRIKLYLGTTGSGKTTLMHKHLLEERRVFLFDMMSAVQFENWGTLCDNLSDGIALAGRCRDKGLPFHIRFQFRETEKFDYVCQLAVKSPHGMDEFRDIAIAVDELSFHTKPQLIPDGLENVIRLGRHTECRFYATTQRSVDIHPLIRAMSREQYLFQMHEPADIDYFAKRLSRDQLRALINLKTGEYIKWIPGTNEAGFSITSRPRMPTEESNQMESSDPESEEKSGSPKDTQSLG